MMPTKMIQQGKQILQLEKISEANLRRCNLDDHDGDDEDEDYGENDIINMVMRLMRIISIMMQNLSKKN